jgi:hypothetical protein
MLSSTCPRLATFVALLNLASLAGCDGAAAPRDPNGGTSPGAAEPDASSPSASQNGGGGDSSPANQGDASPTNPVCTSGSIAFALELPSSPGTLFCLGASTEGLPAGWGASWISILAPSGEQLTVAAPCGLTCDSQSAAPPFCYAADCGYEAGPPTSSSPMWSWDGSIYSEGREPASCGPQPFICYDSTCGAPGTYVAKMCATPVAAADGTSASVCQTSQATPVCTAVPFQWPPSAAGTVVTGTIAVPDGGPVVTADDAGDDGG